MAAIAAAAMPVEARLRALLESEHARWRGVEPAFGELVAVLADFVLGGGKRLRPAFCHWTHVGAGGDPGDPVAVDAGAALELLHAFALLHDDVMDGSSTRRGQPAVHAAVADHHAASGWGGESRRFGEGVAILAGDLAFTWADELLLAAPMPARQVFTELRVELDMGQYLDLVGAARRDSSAARARVVCRYKSGKYTIERPLHLGAALAGRRDELAGPLSAVGLPLGDAFQLVDDLLGVFGSAAATGKPVGDDLREGKPTMLHALAVDRANGAAATTLAADYGRADLDEAGVARLQDVLTGCGAVAEIERMVGALTAEAGMAIDALPFDDGPRAALHELATYIAERDR